MTRPTMRRRASRLIAIACALAARGVVTAQPAPDAVPPHAEGEGSGRPVLRIETPADGSVLNTRVPRIRVCVAGGDETVRPSFEATLDGESITSAFTWSGECAQWRPSDAWFTWDKRHSWSDPPYEEDGWTAELRDGPHEFVASVSGPSGEKIVATARFRIETKHHAVSLGMGFPKVSLEGFEGPFASTNLLEGRLGSQRVSTIARGSGVVQYTEKAIAIAGISTHLADEGEPGETETSLWRFSVGKRKGYGYRTGDVAFIAPYHGTSVLFANLDAYDGPDDPGDVHALAPFDDATKLGSAFEGGLAFGISRSITLDAGFEETAVYPHYVFWEALGSGAVHGLALAVADGVSRQVARSAPRAAPIVSFVLRNGISYAIYHQRRSEVNWPFGGGPGLIYKGLKVSVTFTY